MKRAQRSPLRFPMGATVTFADDSATMALAAIGTPHIATGFVNGKPVIDDAGNITHVPCWCERHGREATTIYVAAKNIITSTTAAGRKGAK